MTNQETSLLRIINQELMENSLDPVCFKEAKRRHPNRPNKVMKCYIHLRFKALKIVTEGNDFTFDERVSVKTTTSCHKHVSGRSRRSEKIGSKEKQQRLMKLELWMSSVILFLGSISALCCLWCFEGDRLSNLPYVPITVAASFIQTIPLILKKIGLCRQLSAASALCVLAACVSCASAVKLLKYNPSRKVVGLAQKQEEVHVITILPAVEEVRKNDQTVSFYKK